MSPTDDAAQWRGRSLVDREGKRVGTITDVYVDRETERPEWVLVNAGPLGARQSFVPLLAASADGDSIRVDYERSLIKNAPRIEPEAELSPDEEEALYRHYGLDRQEPDAPTTELLDAAATAVIRSADEPAASARAVERPPGRLRRYVVTEEVIVTVPVRREEVRLVPELAGGGEEPTGQPQVIEQRETVLRGDASVTGKRVVAEEPVLPATGERSEDAETTDSTRDENG